MLLPSTAGSGMINIITTTIQPVDATLPLFQSPANKWFYWAAEKKVMIMMNSPNWNSLNSAAKPGFR